MSSNLKKGVFSSILLVAESLSNKLVGLVSTLILARVLLPEDFGIIAIASLMVGFIEILAKTGSGEYLLRVDDLDEDKVNTAWTINLILKSGLAVIMIFSTYFIADYYDDPRLINVLICLTLIFFLHSFQNPGIMFLKRTQKYGKIVKLGVSVKIISVVAAVSTALIYESYWALVVGKATNAVFMVLGTHFIYPFKRKLMLKNTRDQWQFSGWMIPQSIFSYFRTQLDTFIVSSTFGTSELGSYHTMKYVSYIPNSQLIRPISEPFLVELTNAKHSMSYFAKKLKASFLLLMIIGLPMCSIMYFHHLPITTLMLGENWVQYSYLLSAFALLIPSYIMSNQSKRVLLVYGKTKQIFFYECMAFIVVYGVLFLSGADKIKEFSLILVIMENVVAFLFFSYILLRYTGFKGFIQMIVACLPLLFATAGAYHVSQLFFTTDINPFFLLVTITTVFAVVFLFIICLSYFIGFKRLSEWQYLESLARRSLRPFAKKIGITF